MAGASVNVQRLRYYTATHLLAAGVDVADTAARLGHSGGGASYLGLYTTHS